MLHGVASSDVVLRRSDTASAFGESSGDVLEIRCPVNGESESIILGGYFAQDESVGGTLDSIVFDDCTSWSYDDVNAIVSQATEGNDNLYASHGGDTVHGLGGNDNLHGGDGDDQLYGDAGIDYLDGGDGDDILSGGGDNDRMNGGHVVNCGCPVVHL
jgi:Ca2+-binding RTX toxin-like protein